MKNRGQWLEYEQKRKKNYPSRFGGPYRKKETGRDSKHEGNRKEGRIIKERRRSLNQWTFC